MSIGLNWLQPNGNIMSWSTFLKLAEQNEGKATCLQRVSFLVGLEVKLLVGLLMDFPFDIMQDLESMQAKTPLLHQQEPQGTIQFINAHQRYSLSKVLNEENREGSSQEDSW